ncbi:MAG TPA: cell division protein SepF [Microbacterium sp.]|nr:cell division protein SepF [Microbacterium sp.]
MSNPLKKTMVYLGLADEEEVYEEPEPQPTGRKSAAIEKAAPVTPLHRPTVVRQVTPSAINEILTVHPKQYRDAQVIAENFRDGIPVIINLSQMSDADARRLIDFASGLSLGLYGRIERVTSKVFLLSPENVAVSGDGAVAQADPESVPFAQQ